MVVSLPITNGRLVDTNITAYPGVLLSRIRRVSPRGHGDPSALTCPRAHNNLTIFTLWNISSSGGGRQESQVQHCILLLNFILLYLTVVHIHRPWKDGSLGICWRNRSMHINNSFRDIDVSLKYCIQTHPWPKLCSHPTRVWVVDPN